MKYWITCAVIIFLGLFNNPCVIYADENTELAGGYTIEGIPNNHQIDKNVSYFYLYEKPGERDQLKIKLINDSSSKKILDIRITNANTNVNGLIDYTGMLKDNKNLKNPLTSMLKLRESKFEVPPKSKKEVTLNIQMPNKKYEGIVLGGIVVSEKEGSNKEHKNFSIGNTYSYTLGVVLTNSKEINLNINKSVELQDVGPVLFDGKKVIQANILNNNPYIFSKAEVKGAIYNEDGKTKIKENSLKNVSIAPYSALPFQIDWQKADLKPGKYIFKGSVKTEENTWNFEKKFEIKNTEAKKINEESVFKVVLPIWFIYSGYFVILINIIGSFYILIRKVKKQGRK